MKRTVVSLFGGLIAVTSSIYAQAPGDQLDSQFELLPLSSSTEEVASVDGIELVEDSGDVVREQFANGQVERHVALDSQGNYVNHGKYSLRDKSGTVLLSGDYSMGVRTGVWTKLVTDRKTPLLKVYPYSKARLPLKSTVEFVDGKMNGCWMIEDADNRVLSQIELSHGVRSGKSVWLHPSGGVLYHCDYSEGQLDGLFIELDLKGKTVRELTYVDGKRTSTETEHYANRTKQAEYTVTVRMKSSSQDEFDSTTLAGPHSPDESIRNGQFVTYHSNGKIQTQGNYENGKLSGPIESWYANGQRESVGEYSQGQLSGKWSWWHANGMRKALASYEGGELVGSMLAWDESGRKTSTSSIANEEPAYIATEEISTSILR